MMHYLCVLLLVSAVAGQRADRRLRTRPRAQDLYFEDTRGIRNRPEARYVPDSAPPPQTLERPDRRPVRPQTEEPRTITPPVAILRQISEKKDDGSYVYGYEGADGSFKIETRYPDGQVKGKYGYVDTNGKVRVIEYGADHLGFQPSGEGITVPPIAIPKETDPFLDYDYPLEDEQPRTEPPRRRPSQRRPAQRRRQRVQQQQRFQPQPQRIEPRPQRIEPQPQRIEPQPERIQPQPQRIEPQPQYNRQRPEPARSQAVPQPISVEALVGGFQPKPQPSPPVYRPKTQFQPQPQPPRRQQQQYSENEIVQEEPPPPPKPFSFSHEVNYGTPQQQSFRQSFSTPIQPAPQPAPRPAPRRPAAPRAPAPAPQQGGNPSILDSLLSQFELPRQQGSKNIHDITFGLI